MGEGGWEGKGCVHLCSKTHGSFIESVIVGKLPDGIGQRRRV